AALACLVTLLAGRRRSPFAARSLGALLGPVVAGGAVPTLVAAGYFAATGTFVDWIAGTSLGLVATHLTHYRIRYPPLLAGYPANDPIFDFVHAPPGLFAHAVHGGRIVG